MSTNDDKKKLLDALRENHIILAACRKAGIGKSTYYRLRKSDSRFARKADEAIQEGIALVNDAAEGTVVGAIKERNFDAAKFWLKHRHPDFRDQILRAGVALAEDGDGEAIIEVFAELKPETRNLLAPYVTKPAHPNDHGKT